MMDKEVIIGNVTTIGKIIAMAVAGWFIGLCVAYGISLPVDQQALSEIIFTVFLLVWAYFDAKYPNKLGVFGNKPVMFGIGGEPVLNDEYETSVGEDDGA